MPDAMGVVNSSVVASHPVHLTGGGNLGSNNDNTSVIPAGTGVRYIQRIIHGTARSAANATAVSIAPVELVLELTNQNLKAAWKQELTEQELVKWLGVCLLITRLDYFGSRRDLWDDPKSYSK
eukprot:scaffold28878_cov101-Skeletonema_dohrnii-CCMP3373.AAC.1